MADPGCSAPSAGSRCSATPCQSSTACIGLLSEEGAPYALIESDEAAVVDWVTTTIDAFGDEATPLDVRSLRDGDR